MFEAIVEMILGAARAFLQSILVGHVRRRHHGWGWSLHAYDKELRAHRAFAGGGHDAFHDTLEVAKEGVEKIKVAE